MNQTTKIRKEGTVLIVSTLILAGTPVMGSVYEPQQKKLPQHVSYVGYPSHNPMYNMEDWQNSENKKAAIMARISEARAQIRQKAKEIQQKILIDSYNESGKIIDAVLSPVKVQVSTIRNYQTVTV